MLSLINFSITWEYNVGKFLAEKDLLGRDELLRPRSYIEETNVVLKVFFDVSVLEGFLCVPRTMVQVEEAHAVYIFLHQEDVLRV